MTTDTSFQEKLQLIQQRFTESLVKRQQEIEITFQELKQDWQETNRSSFHRLLHSLKGSAATFGFEHISQQAEKIEQLINALGKAKPDENDIADLHTKLAFLYELMNCPECNIATTTATSIVSTHASGLTILLAEDEEVIRDQLRLILESQQHRVICASNGQEAVELFQKHQPDMIIMDVIMPVLDGYQATREIKRLCANNFIPVIFLTALSTDDELVRCVEYGGDDFLVKPVNSDLLHARIFAMQRIKQLHQKLEEYQTRTELELGLVRHIFQKILDRNPKHLDHIHYWLSPAGQFSGDMICVQQHTEDDIYLMIGDFTGHGLAAATGALPAADVFYNSAAKGIELAELARGMNHKLNSILPTGYFFACCFIRYQPGAQLMQILNCGLPPIYILDKQSQIIGIKSSELSLGIIGDVTYNNSLQTLDTGQMVSLLAYTDGVVELHNPQGEMLGHSKLEILLNRISAIEPQYLIQHIRSELQRFRGTSDQTDDITLLQIHFSD